MTTNGLSNYNTALIECASVSNQFFSCSKPGDVLFYTTNSNQSIMIGTDENAVPALTIQNNMVGISKDVPLAALHIGTDAICEQYLVVGDVDTYANARITVNGTQAPCLAFVHNMDVVGSVTTSAASTQYNTLSDYRHKNIVGLCTDGLDRLDELPVYKYRFKVDGSHGHVYDGCLAHDIQKIAPYAVTGEKDGDDAQVVDYSKLVPLLIEAVKTLKAEVDVLKKNKLISP